MRGAPARKVSRRYVEPICLECGKLAKLTHTGHDRWVYACVCGAEVGCHAKTRSPLGRPASGETRKMRHRAHLAFDPIWKGKHAAERDRAYKWLARELGVRPEDCHIGQMDGATARRVIELCKARSSGAAAAGVNETRSGAPRRPAHDRPPAGGGS